MSPQEGQRRLKQLFGKRALWRVNTRPSSPEERESIRQRRQAIAEERRAILEDVQRRLAALEWYQAAEARKRALHEESRALGSADYYRVQVGEEKIGCFFIRGSGDNWAEAIRDAEKTGGKL